MTTVTHETPTAPVSPAHRPSLRRREVGHRWLLLGVFGVYAVAAVFVIPTLAPVLFNDDWQYARTVEILVEEGRVVILPFSVANLLFQVFWGGLFAKLFGLSFGVLRVSSVVITLLSGMAFYGLCRELGLGAHRAALGVAGYLFNPLGFTMAFTFMTDPHLTALLVISTYLYVRGLRPGAHDARFVVAGSAGAAMAFLVRQQGILVPVGVTTYLVLSRRLRMDRRGISLLAQVAVVPVVVGGAFLVWLRFVNGYPVANETFLRDLVDAGWSDSLLLFGRMTFIELMYMGLFAAPVAAAGVVHLPGLLRRVRGRGWALFGAGSAAVLVGFAFFVQDGRAMPYIPHFLHRGGLGANDIVGERYLDNPYHGFDWMTPVSLVGILVVMLAVAGAVGRSRSPQRSATALVACLGALQFAVIPVASYGYGRLNFIVAGVSAPSLDRYLLPLLPFVILLGLWAMREVQWTRPATVATWVAVAAVACFSVAGTRDALVMQDATWDLNRQVIAAGVPIERLDGGAPWVAYHVAEESYRRRLTPRTPAPVWWLQLWGQSVDSTYVVAARPLPGYQELRRVEYSQWLQSRPTHLYLLRREGVTGENRDGDSS